MESGEVLELMQEVAAAVITPRFRALAEGEIHEKNPGDLVTVADREAEVLITEALLAAHPDAVVLGEEAHAADPSLMDRFRAAEHTFTVDPVDGTKNFVHGSPDHAVMVSELRGEEAVRAWIWQPEHHVAWVGERGGGVWRNGERVERPVLRSGSDLVGVTSFRTLRGRALPGLRRMDLSWVCCGVDYPRLLEGAADYIIYSHSKPWDHAPGTLLVAEAGGAFGHPDGTPYSPKGIRGGLVVATDEDAFARVRPAAAQLLP